MERCDLSGRLILLFDQYSLESRRLHESLLQTGCDCLAVSLEDNNFLPRGAVSIYDLLSEDFRIDEENNGTPRFFNEIVVPDTWNIHAGDKISGNITYLHEEKGKIYYLQSEKKRLVEAVDWYDRKGCVRFRDHYNRYGGICARTIYDGKGNALCKTWLSESGRERLTENYVSGDFILNVGETVKLFHTKLEWVIYWLTRMGIVRSRIFYNSLSAPFSVSHRLEAPQRKDILFWQEPTGGEIPGNMQLILEGITGRTDKIMVQKRSSYEKLLELGADAEKVHKLGFIYSFKKENGHKPEALICTNSDRMEHCEELIKEFPQIHFHIAAITTMSSKLTELGNYENVSLYPGVAKDVQSRLFQTCDYYFDINYGKEIISAVYQAFLHNHLIFSFQETVHNREYEAEEQIYPAAGFYRMVSDIRAVMADEKLMRQRLEKQRNYAMAEKKETYIELLEMHMSDE